MSKSLPDVATQNLNSNSASTQVDSSTRTCRIGAVEVQDSYAPSLPTSIPSSAEMRAMRAQVGVGDITSLTSGLGTDSPMERIRFHTSVWDAFGAKVCGSAKRTGKVSVKPAVTLTSGAFRSDLWYAQSAVQELHQKQQQLTFNAVRMRSTA